MYLSVSVSVSVPGQFASVCLVIVLELPEEEDGVLAAVVADVLLVGRQPHGVAEHQTLETPI